MEPRNYANYHVVTRKGTKEPLDISIVKKRITDLAYGLNLDYVNMDIIMTKVEQGVYDGITTCELDSLAAETCAYMVDLERCRISFILIIAC